MATKFKLALALAVIGLVAVALGDHRHVVTGAAQTDQVIAWNAIMQRTPATSGFHQTRSAAMMHLAVFEAVNAIVGDYEPYLGTIAAPSGASPDAAAVAAAHRILVSLHPGAAASLDAARAASLAGIPDGPAKNDGIAVGEAAAAAVLARRASDGAANAAVPYTPGTDPGDWQPAPPAFAAAFLPGWGQVTTFGTENGAQFRSSPPPALHTGRYARDYDEVKAVGGVGSTARPQDRTDVARFYGVNLALGVFNEAARQASAAQGKTLSENARIFALLNMAIADGLISSMESKFHYNLWRPVTAIRAGDTDGNRKTEPDPAYLPLVVTPPYPSYPSNFASAAHAACAVLEAAYGADGHALTLASTSPAVDVTLRYSTFARMTEDINDARVYGGIHFRFDQEVGGRLGRDIATYVTKHNLQK
jgi:hypothetical protein